MKLALVGDIGGTNARFALWRNEQLESVRVLATADFPGPEAAIQAYLAELELPLGAVDSVCLACAGPVSGDLFRFTNNHWRISRAAFCRELQVRELLLVNDFSAMALGMTRLRDDERVPVCPGTPEAERPCVVIARFSRRFVDANRSAAQALENDSALPAYRAYHAAVASCVAAARARHPHGALLVADVTSGKCDAVSFGRPYISNPDLEKRIAVGAHWNPNKDVPKSWYFPIPEGYVDYPTLEEEQAEAAE